MAERVFIAFIILAMALWLFARAMETGHTLLNLLRQFRALPFQYKAMWLVDVFVATYVGGFKAPMPQNTPSPTMAIPAPLPLEPVGIGGCNLLSVNSF